MRPISRLALVVAGAAVLSATAQSAPLLASLRSHHHSTDTVRPNGESCPAATAATVAPLVTKAPSTTERETSQSGSAATQPSPCPPTLGDVRTDTARGPALAQPSPLNGPQLIVPASPKNAP